MVIITILTNNIKSIHGNILTMEKYHCESCACTLKTKRAYDYHKISNRHLSRVEIRNGSTAHSHICNDCNKLFSCQSNVLRHRKKCSHVPSTDLVVTEIKRKLELSEEENEKLLATIEDMKKQIVPVNTITHQDINNTITNNQDINNTITNNQAITNHIISNRTNNNTNNHITVQELKIYLNTECKDVQTILNFIENLNISINERVELELVQYPVIVSKIWKRNYLELPVHERPLYCVPTAESECTVFAKGDETWQEQNEAEFMKKLAIRPQDTTIHDTMLATTAIHETCHKIHDLFEEERFHDRDVAARLHPKTKGPDREKWMEQKATIWNEACKRA